MGIVTNIFKAFYRLADQCVHQRIGDEARVRAITLNLLALIGLPLITLISIADMNQGIYTSVWCEIGIFISIILSLFLNRKGLPNSAVASCLFGLIGFSFIASLYTGPIEGRTFLFLSFIGLPIFLIDDRLPIQRFTLCFMTIFAGFYNQSAPDHWYIQIIEVSNTAAIEAVYHIMGSVLIISQFSYWKRVNQTSISKIKAQQVALMESNHLSGLGIMSAGVAHEINNPLLIIRGASEILRASRNLGSVITDREMKLLTSQIKSIDRIQKIITSLKTVSQTGRSEALGLHSISEVVRQTLLICQEQAKSKGIELTVDAGHNASAICNKSKMGQIILSLISNSFDAIEKQTNPWVKITVRLNEDKVEIHIIDSGNGIPDEIQKDILTPFFTTKEIGKGTGLGLSTSLGAMQEQNGSLQIDNSNPNTCFILTLPVSTTRGLRRGKSTESTEPNRRRRSA